MKTYDEINEDFRRNYLREEKGGNFLTTGKEMYNGFYEDYLQTTAVHRW